MRNGKEFILTDLEVFTYFIQADIGGPIKIGKSKHPIWRLKEMQLGSPFPLKILAAVADYNLEKDLHSRFKVDRLHGEWFKPSTELISLVNSIGLPSSGIGPAISQSAKEARERNRAEYKSFRAE